MSLQPFRPNQAPLPPKTPKPFIPLKPFKQPQCGTVNISDLGSSVSATGPGGIPTEYTATLNVSPENGHQPPMYNIGWEVWEFDGTSPLVSGSEPPTGDGPVALNFNVPPGTFHFHATMSAATFLDGPTFMVDISIP